MSIEKRYHESGKDKDDYLEEDVGVVELRQH